MLSGQVPVANEYPVVIEGLITKNVFNWLGLLLNIHLFSWAGIFIDQMSLMQIYGSIILRYWAKFVVVSNQLLTLTIQNPLLCLFK